MPLMDAEAQMCRNDPDVATRCLQDGRDCSARLSFSIGNVNDRRDLEKGKAAYEHLPIVTILGDDGPCVDAMIAHCLCQPGEGIVRSPAGIDLLKRNDIRRPLANDRAYAIQIERGIEIEGAVHIPGHDAHRHPQLCRPAIQVATNWAPRQIPIQPASATASSSAFVHDASLARSAIWDPRAAIARIPGI